MLANVIEILQNIYHVEFSFLLRVLFTQHTLALFSAEACSDPLQTFKIECFCVIN